MGLAVAVALYPQKSAAEEFTGTEFLTWQTDAQVNYVRIAEATATIVATRTNPAEATCLDDWFASTPEATTAGTTELLETIGRNTDYHPGAVIVVALERQCGSFKG